MSWARIAVLALATGCLAAEDVEDANEAPPETPARPVAESDDGKASPPTADRDRAAPPAQRTPSASTPTSTLSRIRTTPLSAAADIPLPQDI